MYRQFVSSHLSRVMIVGCVSLAITACDEPPSFLNSAPKDDSSNIESAPRGAGAVGEKDVEAPEVFKKTEKALWDGRPSLGGVWVAHPSNKKPERVIIRNETNGKFVIGALFGREQNLPGPPFQLSSDAAVALGVAAGSTLDITVTAMRTEKIEKKTPDAPKAAPSEDIASGEKPATTAPDTSAEPTASGDEAAAAEKPKTFKEKMAARKAARAAKKASKVTANTAGDVAQTTLPAAANAPTAQAAPTKQTTPTASPLKKPISKTIPTPTAVAGGKYVQLGLFSVEANAKATLAKVKAKGLQGKIVSSSAKGKTFHRVLAGPAGSASEQSKLLKTIKAMGFSDAYLVKG